MSKLDWKVLELDCAAEAERIAESMRSALAGQLRRRGLIVAISGGIDSSVCAALAVKAVGAARVHSLLLPEQDSASDSTTRGLELARHLGLRHDIVDIAPTLEAIGCYQWRDEAVARSLPAYRPGWRIKIAIAGGAQGQINRFKLIAQPPGGVVQECTLGLHDYLQIVAATSFKQRIRKTIEYFHADRLNYAVVGTPNRLEYDQGFFVKNGDGSADLKPIAHLYKTQVYALARHFGLPVSICEAQPTTDTYSLPQGQDEFYFALPYRQMDLAMWASDHSLPAAELATALSIPLAAANAIYTDIENKRRTTKYLHLPPLDCGPPQSR